MLDKKIANIISRIICTSESSQEFKNDDRVSVIDLFDVYKSRAKKANEFYNSKLNEVGCDLAFIEKIDVFQKNSENLVHMILRLNNDKICLIKMDKKRNLQMEDYYMYDKIPETLFKKYYDLFKLMCTYAIVYNYNDNRRLNTISNEFQILPYFNKFCITMPSKILSECYKHMYLSHYYEKPQYIKSENIINTDIGNFELETNIREIKKLLNVKSNFENVQIDNVVRFLQNLQVYESDIPEYIKPELQKIKSLKK